MYVYASFAALLGDAKTRPLDPTARVWEYQPVCAISTVTCPLEIGTATLIPATRRGFGVYSVPRGTEWYW